MVPYWSGDNAEHPAGKRRWHLWAWWRGGRQHLGDGVLTIRQSKTGPEVELPLHPTLRAALDALPQTNMTFLLTDRECLSPLPVSATGFVTA